MNIAVHTLCEQLRSPVKKNVWIEKIEPSYSTAEFVDSLEFQYSKCLIGNDISFSRSVLWNCTDVVAPSASSAQFKELGLKYALEYIIFVRNPEQGNPSQYFGVDSINIVRCIKRGSVITKSSN